MATALHRLDIIPGERVGASRRELRVWQNGSHDQEEVERLEPELDALFFGYFICSTEEIDAAISTRVPIVEIPVQPPRHLRDRERRI